MSTAIRKVARLLLGGHPPARMLDGFVDSLIQTFENCRAGLSDEVLPRVPDVEAFFAQLYEKERPRLSELVHLSYSHLSETDQQGLIEKIDGRVRDILIPAYARIAGRFTGRERNDFYLSPDAWHGLERLGLGAAAMLLGAFVVWAPFIPIWSKEWVAVFALGGLVLPDLRRLLSWKRYESELNTLVQRTDDEIFRMDLALLSREPPHGQTPVAEAPETAGRIAARKSAAAGSPRRSLMVNVAGYGTALQTLRASLARKLIRLAVLVGIVVVVYGSCTARVRTNEFGVEQRRFGFKTGIADRIYEPGLYFVGPGTTMHRFSREIHVLEASYDQEDAYKKAGGTSRAQVDTFFDERNEMLGQTTHKTIDAINVQTSDGYAVTADVTLLYTIADPVKIAKDFGWGTLYVESFVRQTFTNTVLGTLGKMNAESFYDEKERIHAIEDAEKLLKERFAARGFKVEMLLLRNFKYGDTYEQALKNKKVAVQLTQKNRKELLVNEERATLQQIESRGNAAITIAESEVHAQIAKIRAEANLYSSRTKAKADTAVNIAGAEAKRLKADALTTAGGRYVVALETAKMFDNIDGAVMTPEQYVAFVRNVWALIGVSGSPEGGKK